MSSLKRLCIPFVVILLIQCHQSIQNRALQMFDKGMSHQGHCFNDMCWITRNNDMHQRNITNTHIYCIYVVMASGQFGAVTMTTRRL